jgi:hypothetical protein
MVIRFYKYSEGKSNLLKESTTDRCYIPTVGQAITLEKNDYDVANIQVNYDSSTIIIDLV